MSLLLAPRFLGLDEIIGFIEMWYEWGNIFSLIFIVKNYFERKPRQKRNIPRSFYYLLSLKKIKNGGILISLKNFVRK